MPSINSVRVCVCVSPYRRLIAQCVYVCVRIKRAYERYAWVHSAPIGTAGIPPPSKGPNAGSPSSHSGNTSDKHKPLAHTRPMQATTAATSRRDIFNQVTMPAINPSCTARRNIMMHEHVLLKLPCAWQDLSVVQLAKAAPATCARQDHSTCAGGTCACGQP